MSQGLEYKLACLCDLRDESGRVLLLRRSKSPNQGLCSPIGGKLDMPSGESPAQCARREIQEEAGIDIPLDRLHLLGIISERSYEDSGHWLLFYYLVLGSVDVAAGPMREGELEWHEPSEVPSLPLPDTDRHIIWPLVEKHTAGAEPGFFALHIDCTGGELSWEVNQSILPRG